MAFRRIGFDTRFINDRYQGIGRYAFNLLEAMTRKGDHYTFILFRGREIDSRFHWERLAARPNVQIRNGPWPYFWPHEQLLWPGILKQNKVDLFHSPYFLSPWLSGIPFIITVHDLIFERYPNYMPSGWSRPYYKALMRSGVHRARKVMTVSQASAIDLNHFYRVSNGKVFVVPEGVSPCFSPVTDRARLDSLRQKLTLEHPVILNVGARRPHKNLERLICAFQIVAGKLPHDLLLVGSPDRRFPDRSWQLAQELGLDGRVRFLEWLPEEDLPALYSLADVCVLPSIIEGFGLPALEAMACGTPVIASNQSSLPEVVGPAGVLVDPLDINAIATSIIDLLQDNARLELMAEAGRQRASRYTWENAAEEMIRVYDELFG